MEQGSLWLDSAQPFCELFGIMHLWMLQYCFIFSSVYRYRLEEIRLWAHHPESTMTKARLVGHFSEGCRPNLVCIYWVTVLCAVSVDSALQSVQAELCVYAQHLALSAVLKWSLLNSIPNPKLGLKKENKKISCNAAGKVLPWRIPSPRVLSEGTSNVVWKLLMNVQILHPLTHPHDCCLTKDLKGTACIWFLDIQAKLDLAVTGGWILWREIWRHCIELGTSVAVSGQW